MESTGQDRVAELERDLLGGTGQSCLLGSGLL